METLLAFAVILILITVVTVRYHLPAFLTLIGASIVYALLTGMTETMVPLITGGAGRIFALLAIPIFSGAVIGQVLRQGHFIDYIVTDLRRVAKNPPFASGIAGYILSLPLMCCMTAFIVVSPLVGCLHPDREITRHLLYLTAFGTILSFVLIFPLPVVYSIVTTLGLDLDVVAYSAIVLPLSLILLFAGFLMFRYPGWDSCPVNAKTIDAAKPSRWIIWAPVYVPLLFIVTGYLIAPDDIPSIVNIALFAGAIAAIIVVGSDFRGPVLEKGTRNAGIIMFDLAGAGALGNVIAASAFPDQTFALLTGVVPPLFIPFIFALLVQSAQGSRVVTAVVTSSILAGTGLVADIPAIPLILMIAAGCFVFSYVSDPYFWLVKRTTGADLPAMIRFYTLPLAAAGFAVMVCGLILSILV
jgi:GntP family gluconate:H+ symporter